MVSVGERVTKSDRIAQQQSSCHHFGSRAVEPALVRFVVGLTLCLLLLGLVTIRPPLLGTAEPVARDAEPSESVARDAEPPKPVARNAEPPKPVVRHELRVVEATESQSMIGFLRAQGLWEMDLRRPLPPLVFASFPDDIGELKASTRKRLFLHALAPTAMVALAEVAREREELLQVIGRMELDQCTLEELVAKSGAYQDCGLPRADVDFLLELSVKYRTERLDVLLNRVNVVPLSLILAQGAMESAWGASRFVQEGNNIFGIWTWGGAGMIPADRAQGLTHRVASYDSLLDSVRAYILMLNRVSAYRTLRDIRRESMDSLALVNGLLYYSEKRDRYVDDLRRLIQVNRMKQYDTLTLALPPAEIQRQLARDPVRLTRLD